MPPCEKTLEYQLYEVSYLANVPSFNGRGMLRSPFAITILANSIILG